MLLAEPEKVLRPQPGPQELFLSSPADIAIIGGAVFGGKSWSLVFEPLRHKDVPGFTAAIFRRTLPDITRPGGIWHEARDMYPNVGAYPNETKHEWRFRSGASITFAGLQYEGSVEEWKSAQICLLEFDQLELFTERQFFYMLSRNRSVCGVRPYVRASCNPDPDCFLRTFLDWWIDKDGWAIPERSGKLRWFIRLNDVIHWADTKQQLIDSFGLEHGQHAKSVTFVLARLRDNKIGTAKDPGYEANVRAMSHVDQERLLGGDRGGNWNIRPAAGKVLNRGWFDIIEVMPKAVLRRARGWDKASTEGGGDYSAGVGIAKLVPGTHPKYTHVIYDCVADQWAPGTREKTMLQVAQSDGQAVHIRIEQEPAAGGKESALASVRNLSGYTVRVVPSTSNLVARINPFAAQAQHGHIALLKGDWNEPWLREANAFPTAGVHDDRVSATAQAFNELEMGFVSAGGALV